MKEAVLSIFIKGKPVQQGKFFYLDGKPVFLANINPNKWWNNFNGWSIARQILDAFSKSRLRGVKIIYAYKKRATYYTTSATAFRKHGFLADWGGHQQYILNVKYWKANEGKVPEPYNLPVVSSDRWVREAGSIAASRPPSDVTIPLEIKARLREEAIKQGWYGRD